MAAACSSRSEIASSAALSPVPRLIDDRNMNPVHSQLGSELLLLDHQRVVARVGQGENGLDLVIVNDRAHRPRLLPGPAEDLAGLDGHQTAREDVVMPVPPELLDARSRPSRSRARGVSRHVGWSSHPSPFRITTVHLDWCGRHLRRSIECIGLPRPRGPGIVAGDRFGGKAGRRSPEATHSTLSSSRRPSVLESFFSDLRSGSSQSRNPLRSNVEASRKRSTGLLPGTLQSHRMD